MRTGYNKNLANDAKVKILTEQFHENEIALKNKYDSNGDVIRDLKKELNILAQDENNTFLPSVDLSCFDGFRNWKDWRDAHESHEASEENNFTEYIFTPLVDKVKLAPLPVSENKKSAVEKCVLAINLFFSKLKPLTKQQLRMPQYNPKGWIYPYLIANARRKRKLV